MGYKEGVNNTGTPTLIIAMVIRYKGDVKCSCLQWSSSMHGYLRDMLRSVLELSAASV